jgi:succinylglutamate desuccinylase
MGYFLLELTLLRGILDYMTRTTRSCKMIIKSHVFPIRKAGSLLLDKLMNQVQAPEEYAFTLTNADGQPLEITVGKAQQFVASYMMRVFGREKATLQEVLKALTGKESFRELNAFASFWLLFDLIDENRGQLRQKLHQAGLPSVMTADPGMTLDLKQAA